MSTTSLDAFVSLLRDAGNTVLTLLAGFIEWLPQASVLRIALVCLGLAFFISILPMALVLFLLFMLVKLIAVASLVKPAQLESGVAPSVAPE